MDKDVFEYKNVEATLVAASDKNGCHIQGSIGSDRELAGIVLSILETLDNKYPNRIPEICNVFLRNKIEEMLLGSRTEIKE